MQITCATCGAGPYRTRKGWENHLVNHREANKASVDANPHIAELAAHKQWVASLDQQEAEVQKRLETEVFVDD